MKRNTTLLYYNLISLNTKYFTGFRNFGSMIVQEGKSYGLTKHIDDQESGFGTLNNEEEKNNVEPSNTAVDFHELNILDSLHPKMYNRIFYFI